MDRIELSKLLDIDVETVASTIKAACKDSMMDCYSLYAAAYVLLRAHKSEHINLGSIETYLSTANEHEKRALFIQDTLSSVWYRIIGLKGQLDSSSLSAMILFYEPQDRSSDTSTPLGVTRLAVKLMEVRPGDKVADFGTGRGSFIRECYFSQPLAHYYGNDLNTKAIEIASIRAELLEGKIQIVQEDIFNMKDCHRRFDTAFGNYPFGLRPKETWYGSSKKYEELIKKQPEYSRVASLDWLFNKTIYESIAGPRRAVCIMTNGSTWNTLDMSARRNFIANGSVEAVIALPNNLFDSTNIGTVMIVFSHGNTSTMMVDARELCVHGRRSNVISDENVDEIYSATCEEGLHSKRISIAELKRNNYVLNPIRYFSKAINIENGVPFESVVKKITRGAQVRASDLDEMISDTPTDIQYLMLSNIRDGIIDDDLPYLKKLDPNYERYCIKDNSLIISKLGDPIKVAVANVPDGQRILANGNLFVVELDEEKTLPQYIQAFFESDKGIASLRSITAGASIPIIGVEQLKGITVPMPPIEEQKKVAFEYQTTVDEIRILRRKMDKATEKFKHLLDEEVVNS